MATFREAGTTMLERINKGRRNRRIRKNEVVTILDRRVEVDSDETVRELVPWGPKRLKKAIPFTAPEGWEGLPDFKAQMTEEELHDRLLAMPVPTVAGGRLSPRCRPAPPEETTEAEVETGEAGSDDADEDASTEVEHPTDDPMDNPVNDDPSGEPTAEPEAAPPVADESAASPGDGHPAHVSQTDVPDGGDHV